MEDGGVDFVAGKESIDRLPPMSAEFGEHDAVELLKFILDVAHAAADKAIEKAREGFHVGINFLLRKQFHPPPPVVLQTALDETPMHAEARELLRRNVIAEDMAIFSKRISDVVLLAIIGMFVTHPKASTVGTAAAARFVTEKIARRKREMADEFFEEDKALLVKSDDHADAAAEEFHRLKDDPAPLSRVERISVVKIGSRNHLERKLRSHPDLQQAFLRHDGKLIQEKIAAAEAKKNHVGIEIAEIDDEGIIPDDLRLLDDEPRIERHATPLPRQRNFNWLKTMRARWSYAPTTTPTAPFPISRHEQREEQRIAARKPLEKHVLYHSLKFHS